MYPLIVKARTFSKEGLWIPKLHGEFEDGNPAQANFTIEGNADIKELGGHTKLFFHNVVVKERRKPKPKEEEVKPGTAGTDRGEKPGTAKTEERPGTADTAGRPGTAETADRPGTAETADGAGHHSVEVEKMLHAREEAEEIREVMPQLQVYLTRRRPKLKMTEIDRNGSHIFLTSSRDGSFGVSGTTGTFEVSLKDIPDPLAYSGLVVVKRPADAPTTDGWVIFGMIKFSQARAVKTNALHSCNLGEIHDMLDKATGGLEDSDTGVKRKRKVSDNIKSMSYYRRTANSAWKDFELDPDDEVDFATFQRLIDHQDMFLVEQQALRAYHAVDVDGSGEVGMSEYENFLMAYDLLGGGIQSTELVFMDVYDSFKMKPTADMGKFNRAEGLDFSGFVEACHMFNAKADEEDMKHAIMEVAKLRREEQVANYLLSHEEFKRAWLHVADVETELEQRGLKPERSRFGKTRNRDRLFRYITDQETAYKINIGKINDTVEQVKRDDRVKKDEKKRELKAKRDALELEANKFKAIRGMEKRLLIKKEQEERSKKRAEERLLRNKMLQQKAENDRKAAEAIKSKTEATEKMRRDEIIQKGLDRVDLEAQKLRLVPEGLYSTDDAQQKLSYAEILNLSNNMIEHLPEKNFFYWLSGLRKIRLSYNRLRKLPADVIKCELLEVLEAEENRLSVLPSDFGHHFHALVRLDLNNNQLEELPENLGMCNRLKYVSCHSNYLWHVPSSLAACFGLEYLDLSRNKISELPEDYSHLKSLTYLNVSGNKIGHLPFHIGDCIKLKALDVSHNELSALPVSFCQLEVLEFCNLQNNGLILTAGNFKSNKALKVLLLDRNHIKKIYYDVQCCSNLMELDLNNNSISDLPPEIGLLKSLEKFRCSYNELQHVPLEIGALQTLLNLDLSHNRIEGPVPGPLGLLTSLRALDLSFNYFDFMPESMIGFSELREFRAERNLLPSLPQSITHLLNLEIVDCSNNRFLFFPIQCRHMTCLRELNLRGNPIALLPRNMHTMTGLEMLDLSRCQLRAVPTEFADVFESVPDVRLEDNPWDDLPERWGKLWPGKTQTDGVKGYGVGEAVDFLYGMRAIFATAEKIWEETGVYHYSNRMTLREFLHELRTRLPHTWYEGLKDKAAHLYHTAKRTGAFPRWYTADKSIELEEKAKAEAAAALRERNVDRTRVEMRKFQSRFEKAYEPVEARRRAVRKEEMLAEHAVNEEIAYNMSMMALRHSTRQREERNAVRTQERAAELRKRDADEVKRLKEIIQADIDSGI